MRYAPWAAALLAMACVAARRLGAEAKPPMYPAALSVSARSLVATLSAAQARFDNWRPGGEDSLAWDSKLKAGATQHWGPYAWENNLKLEFGQADLGGIGVRNTADAIHADTTYIWDLGWTFNPYANALWDTQFAPETQYYDGTTLTPRVTSKFMDPGYFNESVGLSYSLGDSLGFKLGAAARQTITELYNQYADDPATPEVERYRYEVGLGSMADLKLAVAKNLLLASHLELFSNLKAGDQVDLRWSSGITAKANDWLSTDFDFDLYYDRDVSTQRQIKEALTLSLSYVVF